MSLIEKTRRQSNSSIRTRQKKTAYQRADKSGDFASVVQDLVPQSSSMQEALAESAHKLSPILDKEGAINYDILYKLRDTIYQKGDELLRQPSYDRVLVYKKSVEEFLRSVTPYLHKKQSINAVKRTETSYEERSFTVIESINNSLNEVVTIVLQTQVDQLSLLASLEKIKGLVVDLLH